VFKHLTELQLCQKKSDYCLPGLLSRQAWSSESRQPAALARDFLAALGLVGVFVGWPLLANVRGVDGQECPSYDCKPATSPLTPS